MSDQSKPSQEQAKRKRSRNGCHRCKRLKVKCDELKPACSLCVKAKHECDYSIKLTWGGRPFKKQKSNNLAFGTIVAFEQKYNTDKEGSASPGPAPAPNKAKGGQEGIIQFNAPAPQPPRPKKKPVQKKTVAPVDPVDPVLQPTQPTDAELLGFPGNIQAHLMNQLPTPNNSVGLELLNNNQVPSAASSPGFEIAQLLNPSLPHSSSFVGEQSLTVLRDNDGHFPSLDNEAEGTPPMTRELMAAFRELETSNTMAKQFLNSVLLPEIVHDRGLKLGSDDDSSPENLTFMENFHTFHSPGAPTPLSPGQEFHSDLFANPLKFFTGFESVPEILIPLPDLLKENPLYRQHYHSYIEVFSKTLVPAPPRGYTDNPFTCLLPKMSLSAGTEGILAVLISFGLCQSSEFKSDPYPQELVKDLLRRALNDLYERLTDPKEANSDYTLALILALTSFEVLCGKSHGWRAHFFGAKNIMFSRGLLKAVENRLDPRSPLPVALELGSEADLSFFFTRWFAYLDVIGALSSSSTIYTESGRAGEFLWDTPVPSFREREQLKDIDPLMGFDLKLLSHLSTIIRLVKERERMYSSAETLSINIIQDALEAKESLLKYLEICDEDRDRIELQLAKDPLNMLNDKLADYRVLRSTNLVFGLSGVLQIYRRVLMLNRESPLVQDIVSRITQSLADNIDKSQSAAYCTIFSLFTTGCEVLDEKTRAFFLERIKYLVDNGLFSARIAMEVMVESWDTGKYWADIIADRKIDVVFI